MFPKLKQKVPWHSKKKIMQPPKSAQIHSSKQKTLRFCRRSKKCAQIWQILLNFFRLSSKALKIFHLSKKCAQIWQILLKFFRPSKKALKFKNFCLSARLWAKKLCSSAMYWFRCNLRSKTNKAMYYVIAY